MDFRVFPIVKDVLMGVHHTNTEELKQATQRIVRQFNQTWYEETFNMWIRRAEKCVRVKGDFIEKTL